MAEYAATAGAVPAPALAGPYLEQFFEAMPVGLVMVDGQGVIIRTNSALASQFGYRVGDLLGHPLERLLPERYRANHGAHMRGYARNPVSRMMGTGRDLTGLHHDGHEFPVEIALTRIDGPDAPGFLAIVSDISARKRAENTLRETNAQLEEFTYVASHDLRSPLRGIGDLLIWIREDLDEAALTEAVRNNFDRALLRIDRSEKMIDDLMTYARAGVRNQHVEQVDPMGLIDEVLSLIHVPDGFSVECDIRGGQLVTQRAPLCSSLCNLVGNAIKHHGQDIGTIRITMRDEGRFAIFTVEDDGQGVVCGADEKIFRLFHRANASTKGDGVGLAVTQRMINAHGGTIALKRQLSLPGACFEIRWPRVPLKEFDGA